MWELEVANKTNGSQSKHPYSRIAENFCINREVWSREVASDSKVRVASY
jgi:hypothetical protein